jgi:PAT family acetyl-CoA transporter-like MFS transporter 1
LNIGSWIDETLSQPNIPIMKLTIGFTFLVFLCATQDIAVDGWAVELLTGDNKTYASTAQSIGLNMGYFLSFTVFLALNSSDF